MVSKALHLIVKHLRIQTDVLQHQVQTLQSRVNQLSKDVKWNHEQQLNHIQDATQSFEQKIQQQQTLIQKLHRKINRDL